MERASWSWFCGAFFFHAENDSYILLFSESKWLDACMLGNSVIKWVQTVDIKNIYTQILIKNYYGECIIYGDGILISIKYGERISMKWWLCLSEKIEWRR